MTQPENTAPKGIEGVLTVELAAYEYSLLSAGLGSTDEDFKAGVDHAISVINNRIAELEESDMHNSTIVSKTRELRNILTLLQS